MHTRKRAPTPALLLTRDAFRNGVFARDNHQCVMCNQPGADAHHIIERRLFPDGGYYLDNGATVCPECHLKCESTIISVEEVRAAAGITRVITPPSMYPEQSYDKWGNSILPDGTRAWGPLMSDDSVRKILARDGMLDRIRPYTKYGRTMHLPWSPGIHDDDKVIDSLDDLLGHDCVVMEKLDGENTTVYPQYSHARSIDSANHPSRDWVKAFIATWQHNIPDYWRVCAENVYAQHSIPYDDLEHYLYAFMIWNDKNESLPFDEFVEWCALLNIQHAPVLYRGIFTREAIQHLEERPWDKYEGFVVMRADGFNAHEFPRKVAKFVRKGHVQTNKHWRTGQQVIPNQLREPYRSNPGLLFAS